MNFESRMLFLSAFLQITALFFTFSRSAWLAGAILLVFSCVHAFMKQRYITYHASLITHLFILVVIFFPLVELRTVGGSRAEALSVSERILGYEESFKIARTYPLVGVGAGNYTAASYAMNPARNGWEYQPVHNVPLLFFAETGVIGLGLFLWVVISYVMYHLSHITYTDTGYRIQGTGVGYKVQALGLAIPLLLFDHYLYSSHAGLLIAAILCGMALRLRT